MASAAGNISAPPAPWTTRNPTIHASAIDPVGVKPHMVDATTKMMTPMTHILRVAEDVGEPAAEREERGQRDR